MTENPNSAPSREPNLLAQVAADNLRGHIARTPPRDDDDLHIPELGPLCDCTGCLIQREAEAAMLLLSKWAPVHLGDFRGQVPQPAPEQPSLPTWLEPVLVLALSLVVGTALLVLLP